VKLKGFAPLLILIIIAIVGVAAFGIYSLHKNSQIQKQITSLKVPSISNPITVLTSTSTLVPTPVPTPTPTPTPVGLIKGIVNGGYYSSPVPGALVEAKGVTNKSTTTNSSGAFELDNLGLGNYILSVSSSDYSFTDYTQTVKEGVNILDRNIHGFLKNPKPLIVTGQNYVDTNGNNTKDSGEPGLNIFLTLYLQSGTGWNPIQTVNVDSNGNFSLSLTSTGVYKLEPASMTFYTQPGPVQFTVDGYGGSKNYLFPYYPQMSQSGFTVYVFNDTNENGVRDDGEEYIQYQNVQVSNTTNGKSWTAGVGPNGFTYTPADYGSYNLTLIPQDSSWAAAYKITKGSGSVTVTNSSGNQVIELGAHQL